MDDTTVLLVGHGSRHQAGNDEIRRFAGEWRARQPGRRVEVCFIELAEVLLDEGLERAAAGARRVVVVPLVLNAAGHVKMELPAALGRARVRRPDVEFRLAPHLGMGPEVFAILQGQLERLMKSLARPDPTLTGVVLLGRGSSDAGANGELAKMTRWVFEAGDHELVDLAFTGVTWPRLETVVQRQVRLGMMQICIVPVYLFTGVLIARIAAQTARLERQYPQIAFAVGTHFGFDPGVFDLVDRRAAAAGAASTGLLECDGCKYREAAAAGQRREAVHVTRAGHGHAHHHPLELG